MYNWSVDEKKFKKDNPKEYRLWRLTQLINYGLDGEKLDKKEVKQVWETIKDRLDPNTKVYLEYLLWEKHPSSKDIIKNYWSLS
ncbi:hypothetical protein A3D03_00620 [Candidatus Gottesmanbacteria bacterium RIFCSPHIGHO2_02_FULL_40_13]|uniref:Uncharacterized protein n=1 Tax=Candidatus Gottesmanbacteria bacterium RIFCSPHIGHO2_02_FULL_40_13 TaxID=1798384 RepID=A0A1F6A706_9BACT|nr:MAG: hypothetical protein A3D03_00620 [Candidatus Gottesmanbacteria bacterium RIFCSPHIGHO2_02_FULL_40_13]